VSAERTARAASAAQELCAALWDALHEQLRAGSPQQAAMLAERIAEASRSIAALALLEPQGGGGDGGGDGGATDHRFGTPVAEPDVAAGARETSVQDGALGAGLRAAAIVDEHEEPTGPPIAIRDARRPPDTPWASAVERRLDRYLTDRERFAVLLVELLDGERLRLAQSPADAERQIREIESAMVAQLRPADSLVREADGRYWLLAPDTDSAEARMLASRIAAAARRCASHRGAPMEVAVGVALCPEHGLDSGALLGHAEVDLYAAQARGGVFSDPDADPAA
jgi:GGDEF domain-containing protein